jgi:3-methyladenine DNA glycosylase AlkD
MGDLSEQIMSTFRQQIARHDRPENRINYQRFFKEPLDQPIGLKTPVLRKIFSSCCKQFRHHPGREIFDVFDQLLASNERYVHSLVFEWTSRLSNDFKANDINRFESWLKNYVNDWAACDSLCGPLGLFLQKFPRCFNKTFKWTKSENRWYRRASAVCLIQPLRKGLLLEEAFKTADALLLDGDDMVQKGYGWMLKEASNVFPGKVFDFVSSRKARMPRTALRYAIEKLPANRRRRLMKREKSIIPSRA